MASRVRVDFDDKRLRKNLKNFNHNLRNAGAAVVDRHSLVTTTWLKSNAPWTDRTGAARSGLLATPHHAATFDEIYMAYSVNYGIWLEVAHDRQYEIITPAMRIMGDALMRDMQHLLDRMINYDA